jgi:phosphate starvation-inducible PhoH-like protein
VQETKTGVEKQFVLKDADPSLLYGANDRNLKIIEKEFDVQLVGRGENIRIIGNETGVNQTEELLSELVFMVNKNKALTRSDLLTAIQIIKGEAADPSLPVHPREELESVVLFTDKNYIKPRTSGQVTYVKAVKENDIVFCIGPAGTGKTYLAVALAVSYLQSKQVSKIVLARPAVEAGESLGYLPGDYREKIDPYLQPLYDALSDLLPRELLKKYLETKVIEVIPMAFMRGRTLNNAFVLLDEAQNSTFLQMKMFLTRLGFNSKSIINGDVTQIDLPDKKSSGLINIEKILGRIDGIAFHYLDAGDVVRHKLVKKIIEAYSQHDEAVKPSPNGGK